jgi:hypothetical protein
MIPTQIKFVTPAPITAARFQERNIAFGGVAYEFAVNSRWRDISDATSLLKAASAMKSGTVVLPYSMATGFRSLARLVAALRDVDNIGLRVVVREQNKRLRLSQASALLSLGASLILPRDMVSASARAQVHALEGSFYRANFRRDVERVIREARAYQTQSRLDELEFRMAAKTLLHADRMDLPHTLVVLNPMTEQGVEAISSRLSDNLRDGIHCAHHECVWILLMACRPLDCQNVLERVLGQRFESLLLGWRKIGNRADILQAVLHMDDAMSIGDKLAA